MTRSDAAATATGRRMGDHVGVRDDVVHLFLAGLGNSSPGHWQRAWAEMLPNAVWLEHASWDAPDEAAWLDDLRALLQAETRPVVAITHSLGCSLLSAWASGRGLDGGDGDHRHDGEAPVIGALVVAPPDVDRPDFPREVTGFRGLGHRRLPFPATVAFSTDDQYCTAARGREIATSLGDEAVELGAFGHVNSDSALGDWPRGQELFAALLRRIDCH